MSNRFNLIIISLLVGLVARASADEIFAPNSRLDGLQDFGSLIEGLNFKVNYCVQSFVNGQPAALITLRESYHSSLVAGLIKQTVLRRHSSPPWSLSQDQRKILYDSETDRLIEYQQEALPIDRDRFFGEDFFLYENGGSKGYAANQEENANHRQWQQHSVRLIPGDESLDAIILLAGLRTPLKLNFDHFMRRECLEVIKTKLRHVNGLSRLLLMIECRRQEFKLKNQTPPGGASQRQRTRAMPRLLYAAPKLLALQNSTAEVSQMDISVTIPHTKGEQNRAPPNEMLPANCVPLSVVLNLAHRDADILLIVNVYQFETIGVLEHVSESSSDAGHSSYLLPLNQIDLNHLRSALSLDKQQTLLGTQMGAPNQSSQRREQFSFRASMTMSRGERNSLLSDPIEMVVLYDGRAALLATQMEFLDRTKSSPLAGWQRDQVRTLYDGQSNTKYHLMRNNFNYNKRDLSADLSADLDPFSWRACATDVLSTSELELIEEGAGELFDITNGAKFMGTALVRGALCYVFERRLNELPKLLGLTMNDYVHLRSFLASEIYAQFFVAAGQHDKKQLLGQQMASDTSGGKFLQLDIRLVGRLSGEMASFRLQIHSFDWSTHLLEDVPDLLDVGQACLASDFQTAHAELKLSLELELARLRDSQLNKHQTEAIVALSRDSSLLQRAVSELFVGSLGISASQQVDLEVQLAELDSKQALSKQLRIEAKLSVYEQAREQLAEQLIGYGQHLVSFSLFKLPTPTCLAFNLGARVYSYDECRWRAAHSLTPSGRVSSSDQHSTSGSSRIFMFCAQSLLCVLGDSSWRRVQTEGQLTIEGLFKFPYPNKDELRPAESNDRCAFVTLELREGEKSRSAQHSAGARSHLDWLQSQRSTDFRRIRDQPLELRVPLVASNGALVSLPLVAKHVKLSRTFNSAYELSDGQVSLLTKPLVGVGYAVMGSAGCKPTNLLAANNNDGPQSVTEPLLADNLAECARNCLLLHNCNSYSACHWANGRVACLFSSLNWSQAAEFERLRLLTRAKGVASSSYANQAAQTQIELQLGEGKNKTKVQVQLRRSKLCSLHARPQAELFKERANAIAGHKPASKFMLPASSADKCARFCQERAHLVRQLITLAESPSPSSSLPPDSQLSRALLQASRLSWPSDSLTKLRAFACHSFHFSPATHSCRLLPMLDHWSLLGLEHLLVGQVDTQKNQLEAVPSTFKTVERWRSQLQQTNQVQDWLKRDQSNFRPPDHFELDFGQLFLARRNRRLKLQASGQLAATPKLQLKILQIELSECAKQCIELLGCRSFDHLQPPTSNQWAGGNGVETVFQTLCVLNTISASDLELNPQSWPMFAYVSEPANGSSIWWHYEPSELALFMLTDPHETDSLLMARAAELLHSDRRQVDGDPILIWPADSKLLTEVFTGQTTSVSE